MKGTQHDIRRVFHTPVLLLFCFDAVAHVECLLPLASATLCSATMSSAAGPASHVASALAEACVGSTCSQAHATLVRNAFKQDLALPRPSLSLRDTVPLPSSIASSPRNNPIVPRSSCIRQVLLKFLAPCSSGTSSLVPPSLSWPCQILVVSDNFCKSSKRFDLIVLIVDASSLLPLRSPEKLEGGAVFFFLPLFRCFLWSAFSCFLLLVLENVASLSLALCSASLLGNPNTLEESW